MKALCVRFHDIGQWMRPYYKGSSKRSKADKKSIAIQDMRWYGYDWTAMDDTGSKELVDLKKENTFL